MSTTTYTSNFNHSMITGNLTRDPEIKEVTIPSTGEIMKVANFTVANNFEHRDGTKDVTFYRASLWGADAERAASMKKGNLVKVRGTIVNKPWIDNKGATRNSLEFHGRTLVDVWDRETKAWAQVTTAKVAAK